MFKHIKSFSEDTWYQYEAQEQQVTVNFIKQ